MARADPNCLICHGVGFINPGPAMQECTCRLRNRALEYLGEYAGAIFLTELDLDLLKSPRILLHADTDLYSSHLLARFQANLIKSYLLHTGMTLRHHTLTGVEQLVKAWVNEENQEQYHLIQTVPILFIRFGWDPPNSKYYEIITSLCDKRFRAGLQTWMLTDHNVSDMVIHERYASNTVNYIKKHFHVVKMYPVARETKNTLDRAAKKLATNTPDPSPPV